LQIAAVALVVEIGKMNDAMGGGALAEAEPPDLQPVWLDPSGIGEQRGGSRHEKGGEKLAAAEAW